MSATAEAPATTPAAAAATSTPRTVSYITPCLLRGIGFAEKVLANIPADKFASCAVAGANHPAFIVGHLSLYPNRIFTLLGRKDLIVEQPGWSDLFQQGSVCVEDEVKYPPKDELVKAFLDGHRKVAEVLPTISDEVLARDNPLEGRMREIFPKVGGAVNFLCTSHLMMHLGQISTWRRAIGLGSAM